MKNMLFKTKQILVGATIVAIFALVAFFTMYELNSVIDGFENKVLVESQVMIEAKELGTDLLEVRRSEKDFNARKDVQYADRVMSFLGKADEVITAMSKATSNEEIKTKLTHATAEVAKYRDGFKTLSDDIIRRGLTENDGIQASFRDAAHKFEAQVAKNNNDNWTVDYLMIRRHEKDYMLRTDTKYVDKNDQVLNSLLNKVQSSRLKTSDKNDYIDLLNNYKKDFHALVKIDAEIKNGLATVKKSADRVLVLSEDINNSQMNYLDALKMEIADSVNSAKTVLWIMIVIALAFGISIAPYMIKTVANPLGVITEAAKAIAQGDLSYSVDFDSGDEVGQLADSFREMMKSLKQKTEFADQIANGNLDIEIKAVSNSDVLGNALKNMQTNLSESNQKVVNALSDAQQKVDYLNNLSFPVHVVDKDMTVLYMNPAGAKISGLNQEACVGKKCYELLTSPHCNTEKCAITRAMRQNISVTSETVVSKNGQEIPIQYTGTPIKDDSGNIIGAMEQAVDITTIKNVVNEVNRVAELLNEGKLNERVKAKDAEGDYKKLVDGFNSAIDNILEPINEVINCLEEVSKGDLTTEVRGDYKGDHAKMKEAMNLTLDSLNGILSQVAIAIDQMTTGAQQVSDSSAAVSQGASEQASSLEETSSSMSEMETQAGQNAENATKANQLSVTVKESAEKGNEQMKQMLEAMGAINDSSGQISKIIKVIDEIAFQTNLLALNAAVEAARAGVHGKGFAVVAEEVRNLAQRSAKAARETTDLIEKSTERVTAGSKISNETAQALNEIIEGIASVSSLIDEITSSSKDQVVGVEQVNQALQQIDQVTQTSTANAEESASAAEELSSQAVELSEMIQRFNLKGTSKHNWDDDLIVKRSIHKVDGNGKNGGNGKQKSARKTKKNGKNAVIDLDDKDFGQF